MLKFGISEHGDGDVIYDDVRERAYSPPTVAGGAALLAVLAAIVTAVLVVSQSSAGTAHHRLSVAVPPVSTAVFAPPTSPATPSPEGRQFFGEVPQVPLLGQFIAAGVLADRPDSILAGFSKPAEVARLAIV